MDIKPLYKEVVETKIPINLWSRWLDRRLLDIHKQRKKEMNAKNAGIFTRFKNCLF